ncbi:hypothetical protein FGU46_03300 [Methanobacterium sp. CWC-01]|uniref:hypothetical protein n=1 Tax=Methanobacterium aridiramus TaxID=2584467 RepID=UPI002578A856|nr:hypothetical protein [Methanobacterium sp. CWC-01]WJI09186.1 hypothetical protein FGU46_03300 [Methanobacterium sp. CWC-01]
MANEITITKYKDEVTPFLESLLERLPGEADNLVNNVGEVFLEYLQEYTPIGCTHELYSRTEMTVTGLLSRLIDSSAAHFPFNVLGTSPHWIGSSIFICGVGWRYIGEHPGTQPNDYPSLAFMDGLGPAENVADEWLNNLLE